MNSLTLVILLAGWAGAAVAPFRDFSGGLNDNAPSIALAPNESPNLNDVVIDEPPGAIKPRPGFVLCGNLPSGNAVTGMFEYFKSDGSRKLIVTDNQNYYQTVDCVTFTTIRSGLSASAFPSFSTVRDKVWVANKSTHVFTWDGTTSNVLDGGSSTPNPPPPKCAFLSFWKEHVWCARSDSNPSGVAFSALTDTSGNAIDPSTGSVAWPASNLIQVDQNGGSPIYGQKVYRDTLYEFKDNGIWKILYENDFQISVVKTFSSVGSRFGTSIVELDDGLLYFMGKDGIYAFNGDTSVRVSDKIFNTFGSINQPLVNSQFKTWTNNSDFGAGTTLTNVDTGTVSGSLLVGTTVNAYSQFNEIPARTYSANEGFYSGNSTWTIRLGNWTVNSSGQLVIDTGNGTYYMSRSLTENNFSGQQGRRYSIDIKHVANTSGLDQEGAIVILSSSLSTEANGYVLDYADNGTLRLHRITGGVRTLILNLDAYYPALGSFHTFDIDVSSVGVLSVWIDGSLKSSVTDATYTTGSAVLLEASYQGQTNIFFDNFKERIYFTTAVFQSDSYNAVTVSTWGAFNVTSDNNSVAPSYAVRVGSNTGGLNNAAYVTTNPGSLINGTSAQTLVQYKITTVANSLNYLEVYDVTVNYSQGGSSSQNVYGARRKNRLWMSASTGTATADNLVLVKTRSQTPSWVPYKMQIGPMTEFNDYFYAGASTCSAIYRMEYGTNDNGAVINSLWESRDEVFGDPTRAKALDEIVLDFQKSDAANLKIGFSKDNGATYSDKTVDITGTGRGTKRLFINGGNSTNYRFRITDSNLDESYKIYGLDPYAEIYQNREN